MDLKLTLDQTKELLSEYYDKIVNKNMSGGAKKKPKRKGSKKKSSKKILNPITGRYVNRDGKIGKQVLSMKNTQYVDTSLKRKSKKK